LLFSPMAQAGRWGGPASTVAVVTPYQSATFDVLFVAGEPGMVATTGAGLGNVQLILYDSDGHVMTGTGYGDRRLATFGVYRTGWFRIEVHNFGPRTDSVLVATN